MFTEVNEMSLLCENKASIRKICLFRLTLAREHTRMQVLYRHLRQGNSFPFRKDRGRLVVLVGVHEFPANQFMRNFRTRIRKRKKSRQKLNFYNFDFGNTDDPHMLNRMKVVQKDVRTNFNKNASAKFNSRERHFHIHLDKNIVKC